MGVDMHVEACASVLQEPLGDKRAWMHVNMRPFCSQPCGKFLVMVIDVSASMSETLTTPGVELPFCCLDLVKHALLILIAAASPLDIVSIVTFSETAKVVMEPTRMEDTVKERASALIRGLQVETSTDLIKGLEQALALTSSPLAHQKPVNIGVFTDGKPSVIPMQGICAEVKTLWKDKEHISASFLAFGYDLEKGLLPQLAEIAGGLYCFIPDASMLSTTMLNWITYTMLLCGSYAQLTFVDRATGEVVKPLVRDGGAIDGAHEVTVSGLVEGQGRDLVWPLSDASVDYLDSHDVVALVILVRQGAHDVLHEQGVAHSLRASFSQPVVVDRNVPLRAVPCLAAHVARISFARALSVAARRGVRSTEMAAKEVQKAYDFCDDLKRSVDDPGLIAALMAEMKSAHEHEGQAMIAVESREFYLKWGRHFLPSLRQAIVAQVCINFKDPALQLFAGDKFVERQRQLEAIYSSIEPPVSCRGSAPRRTSAGSWDRYASVLYNASGGCFSGSATVRVGPERRVVAMRDVRAGMEIECAQRRGNGTWERVLKRLRCVVETVDYSSSIIRTGTLEITPWHPCIVPGTRMWTFPAHMCGVTDGLTLMAGPSVVSRLAPGTGIVGSDGAGSAMNVETVDSCSVYNLLLEEPAQHALVVSGVICAALGHRIEGDVIGHTFFGTDSVVRALERLPGFSSGRVCMETCAVERLETDFKDGMLADGHGTRASHVTGVTPPPLVTGFAVASC